VPLRKFKYQRWKAEEANGEEQQINGFLHVSTIKLLSHADLRFKKEYA